MLDTSRVVLVEYDCDEGKRRGSGLWLRDEYVLTADHCARGLNTVVYIQGAQHPATVFVRSESSQVDLAVLRVQQLAAKSLPGAIVNRRTTARIQDCQALGYPTWKDGPDGPVVAQVSGYVPTAEGLDHAGRTQLDILSFKITDPETEAPANLGDRDHPTSQWAGMSGAVVVTAGGTVLGVVRGHRSAEGSRSLTFTGLDKIDALPPLAASQFWSALGVSGSSELAVLPAPHEGKTERLLRIQLERHRAGLLTPGSLEILQVEIVKAELKQLEELEGGDSI